LLQPGLHKIIGFATRTQGLITAAGNPQKLHSLADVVSTQARFVQRSQGTGTRVLLDDLLAQAKLNLEDLNNWPDEEPSHTALAEAIASGRCDVGLGIESTARARGLGFVPLVQEEFHLVCLKSALDTPATQALRDFLQEASWQQALNSLPGYQTQHGGEVQSLSARLPWWAFPRAKKIR
jgi:molybdate-binding protein